MAFYQFIYVILKYQFNYQNGELYNGSWNVCNLDAFFQDFFLCGY